jgi:error-prone DNA polymerase
MAASPSTLSSTYPRPVPCPAQTGRPADTLSGAYAELHCLTNFTFLRGASHPEELVERAAELGYRALAITDECSLAGVVRAHVAAKTAGLKILVGAEFRLRDGLTLVLLAQDREGYGNLSGLITRARRAAPKGSYRLERDDFASGLPGCLTLFVPGDTIRSRDALFVREVFADRAWITAELHHGPDDRDRLGRLKGLSARSGLPLVAAGNVHMHIRGRRRLQDTLTAIRLRLPVAQVSRNLHPNGERCLRPLADLVRIYPPELLAETAAIVQRCTFSLDCLRYEYPEELVPPGLTPAQHLRRLTEEGLRMRFPAGCPQKVRALIEHELSLIAELCYEAYFLTVHEMVAFARSRGILCQGRGSAANSAVCYALGITEVDPARMSMLFERFVSRERNEPPDIDIDFEHERREEVIQHIFDKYGRDRAALAATVVTYRMKSALRDIGKALGLTLEQLDRLSGTLSWWSHQDDLPRRLHEAGLEPGNPLIGRIIQLTRTLIGFPRHLSQHVGGLVISRGPLSRLVPIENAAMKERTVIQWDKDDLDALGLLKVDVLALGMLTAISRALDLIGGFRGSPMRLQDIPAEDPVVYEMIRRADTVGVFQIESRAQMSMLPRLKPRNFYDLVIEIAIVRPGPIQGDMVHPYLKRRQNPDLVEYPGEEVKAVLERTLGVPIFQEQVMQLAVVAAGFTPGEADRLRRSMAAWRRRGGLEPFEQRLKDGMKARGYSEEFAGRIYRQILGFGEYGFPESHSASFALLAYASAWLKHHEPAAFLAALLNSQPMGFYGPSQLVQDARRHGVEVRPVDILHSEWDCTLEKGEAGRPAVRLGLRMVSGLSRAGASRLLAVRLRNGLDTFEELTARAKTGRHEIGVLAAAGVFESMLGHRRKAAWAAMGVEPMALLLGDMPVSEHPAVFAPPTEGQDIVADYSSLGLSLRRHPLALLRGRLKKLRVITAEELLSVSGGQTVRVAGLVTCRQRPSTAKGTIFITLEDETGSINVVVWHDLADRQHRVLLGARLLSVDGRLERENEVLHLIARHLTDHSRLLGKLTVSSRDFQ